MAIDGSLSFVERDGAVLASTVLLLRPTASGPEVLLLKRNSNARNMADVWMFPGGKVDEDDHGPSELDRVMTAAVRELEEEADVLLPVSALTHFSHWLTPAGMKRRFATWFFGAELPEGAAVSVDGEEMVEARWVRPEDAVAEHQAGKLRLPPPTVVSLID
jgi:8-oxo-dGTP pyrophosphatase MutT (NUDIX family)